MSTWPEQSQFDDRNDIVVAEIVRPRTPWLLFLCVFLAFLFAVGLIAIWWKVNRRPASQALDSLARKQAEVSLAFGGTSVGVDNDEVARIDRLFRQVMDIESADVGAQRTTTFDMQRYLDQVHAYSRTQDFYASRLLMEQSWKDSFAFPTYWTDFRIRYVKLVGNDEARAYGYFWAGDSLFHVRWWLKRHGDHWRFFDWELLDFGMSFAHKIALFSGADALWMDKYFDVRGASDDVYELLERDGREKAAAKLNSVSTAGLPANLRDNALLHLARAWSAIGDKRRAMRCCLQARSPMNAPGIYFLIASTYVDYGQPRDALQAMQQYEHWCGMGPDSIEIRADVLETLDRASEAIQAWKQLLAVQPDHVRALRALADLLDDEQKEILLPYIELCPDGLSTARSLAQWSANRNDRALASVIARWLKAKAPDSADAVFADGLLQELAGNSQAAADCFFTAFQKGPPDELQAECRYRYVDAVMQTGRVAQLLDTLPAPRETLETVYYLYDEQYGSRLAGSILQFVSAYQQRFPDDPYGHYYAGVVLTMEERHQEGIAALRAALAKCGEDDADLRESIESELVYTLTEDGQDVTADDGLPPGEQTFRQLADHYERANRYAELERLLLRHEATETTGPWVDYYQAVLALEREDYQQVRQRLAQLSNVEDESLQSALRRRQIDLAVKTRDIDSLIAECKRDESLLTVVVSRLQSEQLSDLLDLFLQRCAVELGDQRDLLPIRVELCADRHDDQKVIDILHPWPDKVNETTLAPHAFLELRDALLRSYLHLQRYSDAESLARQIYETEGDRSPQLLVAASRSDVARVAECLDQLDPSGFSAQRHYRDPDLGRILRTEAFRDIRNEHPPDLPFRVPESTIVLLNRDPVRLDVEQLRERLAGEATLVDVIASPVDHAPTTAAFQHDDTHFLVVCGQNPYHDSKALHHGPSLDADLLTRLQEHRGWIAVQAFRDEEPSLSLGRRRLTFTESEQQAGSIASKLVQPETLAVYAFREGGRLMAATEDLPGMMGQADFLERLVEMGKRVYLSPAPAEGQTSEADDEVPRDVLGDACRAWLRKSAQEEILIEVDLGVGMASERHWLVLERPRRGDFGTMTARARFSQDPRLFPSLAAGEAVIVDSYEVRQWKLREPSGGSSQP